jgi:lysozyme
MWRMTSRAGRNMIESFEGRRNKAYRDVGGVYTCGIGCTGPDINADTVWTDDEVEEYFSAALRRVEVGVNRLATVPLSQNQFDSLVSLAFNVGLQNFKTSTLLRLLNRGEYRLAAAEFGRWIHVSGAVLPALVRRRRREAEMFLQRD